MGTRFALASNRRQVAARIKDKFTRLGYTGVYLDSFMVSTVWNSQNFSMWEYNVVANLHGAVYPDSLIILGAHYDDILRNGDPTLIAPGANDNASGVAAMFEIARVMKLKNYSPRISIQFVAFGAEELGLLGSADFASNLAISGRPVKMMINNDMIGYQTTTDPVTWLVNILSYDNSLQIFSNARTLCNRYAGIANVNDNTLNKNSDSYSFYKNGFQTIFFFSRESDPNYHTTNDLTDYMNFDYCKKVASISCALMVYAN
jgi:leucyl aminopeptidase